MARTEMNDVSKMRKVSNIFVNPKVQGKFLLLLVGTGFVLTIVHCWMFYLYNIETYRYLVELAPQGSEIKSSFDSDLLKVLIFLALSSLVFTGIIALIALIFSHRLVGPLYSLKNTCDQIRDGKTDLRLHFRSEDELKEIGESFNQMLDSILGRSQKK